jgi:hypothetical protein
MSGEACKPDVGDLVRIEDEEKLRLDLQKRHISVNSLLYERVTRYAGRYGKITSWRNEFYFVDGMESIAWCPDKFSEIWRPVSLELAFSLLYRGQTLKDATGADIRYDPDGLRFYGTPERSAIDFENLYQLVSKRAEPPAPAEKVMTAMELLCWAASSESFGWLIRETHQLAINGHWKAGPWYVPQGMNYHRSERYERVRINKEGTGIDPDTIVILRVRTDTDAGTNGGEASLDAKLERLMEETHG